MSAVTSISGGIHQKTWHVQACQAAQHSHTKLRVFVLEKNPQKILFKNKQKHISIIFNDALLTTKPCSGTEWFTGQAECSAWLKDPNTVKQGGRDAHPGKCGNTSQQPNPDVTGELGEGGSTVVSHNKTKQKHLTVYIFKKGRGLWLHTEKWAPTCRSSIEMKRRRWVTCSNCSFVWLKLTCHMRCGRLMFQLAHTCPYIGDKMSAEERELRQSLESQQRCISSWRLLLQRPFHSLSNET